MLEFLVVAFTGGILAALLLRQAFKMGEVRGIEKAMRYPHSTKYPELPYALGCRLFGRQVGQGVIDGMKREGEK